VDDGAWQLKNSARNIRKNTVRRPIEITLDAAWTMWLRVMECRAGRTPPVVREAREQGIFSVVGLDLTNPGAMQFTVMPKGPSSCAI
jgi:hypothetical protein